MDAHLAAPFDGAAIASLVVEDTMKLSLSQSLSSMRETHLSTGSFESHCLTLCVKRRLKAVQLSGRGTEFHSPDAVLRLSRGAME